MEVDGSGLFLCREYIFLFAELQGPIPDARADIHGADPGSVRKIIELWLSFAHEA